jgi:hypothetical protein
MNATVRMLAMLAGLGALFLIVGCATNEAGREGAGVERKPAEEKEVTGKVVGGSPCGTMLTIEVANPAKGGEAEKMGFFAFDPEMRKSAREVKKGDLVRIRYIYSIDTQRNHPRKIEKVSEGNG